jgi:plasmid stabilization system protein ParE
MKPRYILAPEAARDLVEIWSYLKEQASQETAEHVESVIRERIVFLSQKSRRWSPATRSDRL